MAGGPAVVAVVAAVAAADSEEVDWEEGHPVGLSWGAGWWTGGDEGGSGGQRTSWAVRSR